MSIVVEFRCGGCDATAPGTGPLREERVPLTSGSNWHRIMQTDVRDIAPEGWCAYDPWTLATYCPDCWAEISRDKLAAERSEGSPRAGSTEREDG